MEIGTGFLLAITVIWIAISQELHQVHGHVYTDGKHRDELQIQLHLAEAEAKAHITQSTLLKKEPSPTVCCGCSKLDEEREDKTSITNENAKNNTIHGHGMKTIFRNKPLNVSKVVNDFFLYFYEKEVLFQVDVQLNESLQLIISLFITIIAAIALLMKLLHGNTKDNILTRTRLSKPLMLDDENYATCVSMRPIANKYSLGSPDHNNNFPTHSSGYKGENIAADEETQYTAKEIVNRKINTAITASKVQQSECNCEEADCHSGQDTEDGKSEQMQNSIMQETDELAQVKHKSLRVSMLKQRHGRNTGYGVSTKNTRLTEPQTTKLERFQQMKLPTDINCCLHEFSFNEAEQEVVETKNHILKSSETHTGFETSKQCPMPGASHKSNNKKEIKITTEDANITGDLMQSGLEKTRFAKLPHINIQGTINENEDKNVIKKGSCAGNYQALEHSHFRAFSSQPDEPLPLIECIERLLQLPDNATNVEEFATLCHQSFVQAVADNYYGRQNELELSAIFHVMKIGELCEEKYEKNECNNVADEIAQAFHIVNNMSLKNFEWLSNNGKSPSQHGRNIIIICCVLLMRPSLCRTLSLKCQTDDWYGTKLKILQEFLRNHAKQIDHSDSEESIQYLLNCAEELNDPYLRSIVQTNAPQTLPGKCGNAVLSLNTFRQAIDVDGNVYDRARDPPGQRSVYIPPGDSMKESYRLSTFIKYPQEVPVNPRYLASAGFFYTGYKDRVKCFSCGLCVENWVFGDDVKSHKWHRIDCLFIKGGDSGNEAIGGGFARFMSNNSQPSTPARQPQSAAGSNGIRNNAQPALQESAGSLLLKHAPSSNGYSPMQTARPVAATSQHQVVEFATITSAYHENFLRNLDLRKESERIRTYEHWPSEAPTVSPKDLAKSGFFYLGNLDRVQCFSCGGVLRNWNYGDHVESEHRRHFSHCKMVQGAEPRNVRMSNEERATVPSSQHIFHEPPDPTPEQARDLRNMFPCNYAVNPHMRNVESRHATFDTRWPSANINATPRQIANAGFFYLGERDRVKCWYCNGGLQNWDKEDEPWTEHAKWFPTCEFLLQRKGPDFVHRMVSMFPNLNRPILRGPHDVAPSQQHRQIGFSSGRSPSPPPQIIDPQVEMQRQQEELRKAMDSVIVKSALDMGFQEKTLKRLIKTRLQNNNEVHSSVEELIDDVTNNMGNESESDEEEENNQIRQNQSIVRQAMPAAASNFASMETEGESASMQDRIRELQEERNCKICLDQPADVVFVPCGHLCSCKNCAQALRKCPICRKKIEKAIRTYLS